MGALWQIKVSNFSFCDTKVSFGNIEFSISDSWTSSLRKHFHTSAAWHKFLKLWMRSILPHFEFNQLQLELETFLSQISWNNKFSCLGTSSHVCELCENLAPQSRSWNQSWNFEVCHRKVDIAHIKVWKLASRVYTTDTPSREKRTC